MKITPYMKIFPVYDMECSRGLEEQDVEQALETIGDRVAIFGIVNDVHLILAVNTNDELQGACPAFPIENHDAEIEEIARGYFEPSDLLEEFSDYCEP